MILLPEVYARDCDECRCMWYDDEGKPVTRNGKHLPRPCPPACHRCKKHQLGIESLWPENQRCLDLHTDATLGMTSSDRLTPGERQVLRLIHRKLERVGRMRLAADIAEVMHGRA